MAVLVLRFIGDLARVEDGEVRLLAALDGVVGVHLERKADGLFVVPEGSTIPESLPEGWRIDEASAAEIDRPKPNFERLLKGLKR